MLEAFCEVLGIGFGRFGVLKGLCRACCCYICNRLKLEAFTCYGLRFWLQVSWWLRNGFCFFVLWLQQAPGRVRSEWLFLYQSRLLLFDGSGLCWQFGVSIKACEAWQFLVMWTGLRLVLSWSFVLLAPMVLNASGLIYFLGQTGGQVCKAWDFHSLWSPLLHMFCLLLNSSDTCLF